MNDEQKNTSDNDQQKSDDFKLKEETPVSTQHSIRVGRKTLKYTATVGRMPLKDDKGEVQANMSFFAYTLDDVKDVADRPLAFVYNGGPGSSSVWLHLGAVGPKRVVMQDEGWMPQQPYRLEDNPHTWLDMMDMVFIDPVGTGYSRAENPDKNKENYWTTEKDIESVGEFIRMYLTRYSRWASPLFLAGESYGTTRSAGLSDHLLDRGMAVSGIVLISTVLNMQGLRFERGNDLPYHLYLPTYAATAWYHGKLDDDLQAMSVAEVVALAEAYAEDEYALALLKGDKLDDEDYQYHVEQVARFTGLTPDYVDRANLRVHIIRFCKELRRDDRRTVGRLDSRFEGNDADAVGEFFEFDPSFNAIIPPYTAMFNQYVRAELGYESDLKYEILSFQVNQNWDSGNGKFTDTSEALRKALSKNPHTQVMAAQGYYDLATPHFAWLYTFNHMNLTPEQRARFRTTYYEAGHMMYLHTGELEKLKQDVLAFVGDILK